MEVFFCIFEIRYIMSITAIAIILKLCFATESSVGSDAPIHFDSYVDIPSLPLSISFSESLIKLSAVTSVN